MVKNKGFSKLPKDVQKKMMKKLLLLFIPIEIPFDLKSIILPLPENRFVFIQHVNVNCFEIENLSGHLVSLFLACVHT